MASPTPKPCAPLPSEGSKAQIVPGENLQQLFTIIGFICTIITVVIALLLLASHLRYRANLTEQRIIMRIVCLPSVYSIFALLSIIFYTDGQFFDPIPKLYDVYVVASFFQLMVHFVAPDERTREQFFVNLERRERRTCRRSTKKVHDRGSLRWFKYARFMVNQSPILLFILTIIGEILPNVMCRTSFSFEAVSAVIEVVNFLSTGYALLGLFRVFSRLYIELKEAGAVYMLIVFKATIFVIIHQQIIVAVLVFSKVVTPTEYMNLVDFQSGIPEFLIVCEMMLFSFWYFFAFSATRYRRQLKGRDSEFAHRPQSPDASIGAYLNGFLNPIDVIQEILISFRDVGTLIRGRKHFDYTGGLQKSHEDFALLEAAAKPGESSPRISPYQDRSRSPSPNPLSRRPASQSISQLPTDGGHLAPTYSESMGYGHAYEGATEQQHPPRFKPVPQNMPQYPEHASPRPTYE